MHSGVKIVPKNWGWLFVILVVLYVFPVEAQCAMCRAVLESEEGQQTAKGVNNGIVYLMVIPYILIALIGYFIYRNFRGKKENDKQL